MTRVCPNPLIPLDFAIVASDLAPPARRERVKNPYSSLPNWLYPSFVVVMLSGFTVYGLWTSLFQGIGQAGPYLSPFFSPPIKLAGIPPALFVAWAPLSFRATCYYYRKAYFRSFFGHPRSCAVPEAKMAIGGGVYKGETALPWVLNNLHRYAFYATAIQVVILWYDVTQAFNFKGHFGVGLGTLLMVVNVIMLSGYTFGCHAFRHLAGGKVDCFSCSAATRARHKLWKGVSVLNVRHDKWAWASLFTVISVDLYIRLLQYGVVQDLRFF
ncbi:MAG TPA: hypothetical protein VG015_02755 [Candidatus Dormibacteraeota bacterium]|jgi:hypothetical protein|nr:hypothetical protein [Candidatus Dormibacteraeota bacterium]